MVGRKTIIINAFRGIGDIIFSIPIYRKLLADGYNVLHPFTDEFGPIWKHWPEITWIPWTLLNIEYAKRDHIKHRDYEVLPLRFSDSIAKVVYQQVMRAKYDMMGMDFNDWRQVTWERDMEAENNLVNDLGIVPGEEFVFVNTRFRSSASAIVPIKVDAKGRRIITMAKIKDYTLMDWGRVLELASEIHTVGTGINYIIDPDFLDVKCPVHLYIRRPEEKDFNNYNYLLKKEYIFHNE